ncbi:MAG: 4Fe-4S binding protein [Deltaproteobacteria bacterium]|nr:4Fe-4S binding protein [Deltaproteobacteria bacterium]
MKAKRKIIRIDEELCDGCGQCVPSCAEGAIEIVDGKAKVLEERFCDGLGACMGECPNGALSIEERVTEDFDEEAVEEHLASRDKGKMSEAPPVLACGCPSTQIQTFIPLGSCEKANQPAIQRSEGSELTHWPVQIRLVPPNAPFLRGTHLLVAADCAAVACPDFHRDFLKGKAVMLGCPKFDDVEEYVHKFRDIFRMADIKSVTVLDMEVPCCSGLPRIVMQGMEKAGKKIPLEEAVITPRGEILKREKLAA